MSDLETARREARVAQEQLQRLLAAGRMESGSARMEGLSSSHKKEMSALRQRCEESEAIIMGLQQRKTGLENELEMAQISGFGEKFALLGGTREARTADLRTKRQQASEDDGDERWSNEYSMHEVQRKLGIDIEEVERNLIGSHSNRFPLLSTPSARSGSSPPTWREPSPKSPTSMPTSALRSSSGTSPHERLQTTAATSALLRFPRRSLSPSRDTPTSLYKCPQMTPSSAPIAYPRRSLSPSRDSPICEHHVHPPQRPSSAHESLPMKSLSPSKRSPTPFYGVEADMRSRMHTASTGNCHKTTGTSGSNHKGRPQHAASPTGTALC